MFGLTPMHYAARYGRPDVVKTLGAWVRMRHRQRAQLPVLCKRDDARMVWRGREQKRSRVSA